MIVTHYTNSKGELVEIATMEHAHLVNACNKLIREDRQADDETIRAMRGQIAENEARFAAQRQELEAEGIMVVDAPSERNGAAGFQACRADGEPIPKTWSRNDGAAWGLAWKALRE